MVTYHFAMRRTVFELLFDLFYFHPISVALPREHQLFFCQVWRSVRDWDPQSREMLSAYLHAAKSVIREKQALPGVAVHVRLDDESNGREKQGNNGTRNNGVANSFAAWAWTGEYSTTPDL